jgi:hypothetical protein
MAQGDVKSGIVSIGAFGSYSIRPPVGEEWVIHNVHFDNDGELRFSNGTDFITLDTVLGNGSLMGLSIHITNTNYLTIINSSVITASFGYDGVQTK